VIWSPDVSVCRCSWWTDALLLLIWAIYICTFTLVTPRKWNKSLSYTRQYSWNWGSNAHTHTRRMSGMTDLSPSSVLAFELIVFLDWIVEINFAELQILFVPLPFTREPFTKKVFLGNPHCTTACFLRERERDRYVCESVYVCLSLYLSFRVFLQT